MNIRLLPQTFDVAPLASQLAAHPEIWDAHPWRTQHPQSPHREVSDCWARYNAIENLGPEFNDAHLPVWYPVCFKIPAVRDLAWKVLDSERASALGGVLVTKIPAGKQVYPHADFGWHAEHYEKIAVQIAGNSRQAFCFKDESVSAEAGQSYWFRNQAPHWVTNSSDEDRITLIVCIRRYH